VVLEELVEDRCKVSHSGLVGRGKVS
jgi:hypothetical protein